VTERPELREQVGMNTLTRAQLASKLNALELGVAPLAAMRDEAAQHDRTHIPYQRTR